MDSDEEGAPASAPKLTRQPSKLRRALSKLRSNSSSSRRRGDADGTPGGPAGPAAAKSPPLKRPAGLGPDISGLSLAVAMSRSGGGSGAGAGTQDPVTSTAAKIKMFEEGSFNLEAGLGSLTEKGLDSLRDELAALDGEVLEALKRAVHAQYATFIRATPDILALEGDVVALRNLLHSMSQLTQSLRTISAAVAQSQRRGADDAAAAPSGADAEQQWRETGDGAKWGDCIDDCDVAIAERRVPEALAMLQKLERMQQRLAASGALAAAGAGGPAAEGGGGAGGGAEVQARAEALSTEVEARRQALVPLAEHPVRAPTASPADIRGAAALLANLAGRQHAQRVVLEAYSARLQRQYEGLLKPANAGGADADGCDYAAALGQKLVLALGQAIDDCAVVFGAPGSGAGGGPDLAAAQLVWALHETERACHLLRKHALAPFAAPAGLPATSRCIFVFLSYACALEASHSLRLAPTVHREVWPVLEQVLLKRGRKAGEALRRSAYTEVDLVEAGSAPLPQDLGTWEALAAVFPSADFLVDELESMTADVACIHTPRAAAAVRKVANDLFQGYTNSIAAALSRSLKKEESAEVQDRMAYGVEVAMEAATVLVERLLPDATSQLSEIYGDICGAALGEQLVRMGETLGMTTVPLTPGLSKPASFSGDGRTSTGEDGGGAGAAGAVGQQSMEGGEGGEGVVAEEESSIQYITTSEE